MFSITIHSRLIFLRNKYYTLIFSRVKHINVKFLFREIILNTGFFYIVFIGHLVSGMEVRTRSRRGMASGVSGPEAWYKDEKKKQSFYPTFYRAVD
jgi:hypothetical protein